MAPAYISDIISRNGANARVKNDSTKPDKRKAGSKANNEFVQLREAIIGAVNDLFQQRQYA